MHRPKIHVFLHFDAFLESPRNFKKCDLFSHFWAHLTKISGLNRENLSINMLTCLNIAKKMSNPPPFWITLEIDQSLETCSISNLNLVDHIMMNVDFNAFSAIFPFLQQLWWSLASSYIAYFTWNLFNIICKSF